jgi:hypothetical protein
MNGASTKNMCVCVLVYQKGSTLDDSEGERKKSFKFHLIPIFFSIDSGAHQLI